MSFVKTLATLAAGFAAAKGYDKVKAMGGLAGVAEALKANPATAGLAGMMGKIPGLEGKPGAADAGFLAAAGGAAAAGATGLSQLFDQFTGTTAATSALEANARLMIRTMIMAAKADGEIDARERAILEEHLGEASAEELAFVRAELAAPVDPAALAQGVSAGAGAQVYIAAATMARSGSAAEAEFLSRLATALGLSAEIRSALHVQSGVPMPQG